MRGDETTSAIITAEDRALYELARERMEHDDGRRYTMDEAFGEHYRPADDGFDPEFE
ncbi:hypothetical protein B1400_0621 [Bifidobacterium italicum]|uniref:Uncharacterized protein n=2 Tax=Bifidobacterium italicum TaxID=1960968 RepID=A0A2A2EKE9_9BIFI|nr:hypothetical protein B1400_0621 [Bifidobacterium italicum]